MKTKSWEQINTSHYTRMDAQTKLNTRIAELRERRKKLKSRYIQKLPMSFTANMFAQMLKDKRIVVADWNRDEVKVRAGNAKELMISLATGADIGKFLVYWNGNLVEGNLPLEKITAKCPLQIYEGGHRSRWLSEIFNDDITYEGFTLSELKKISNPKDEDDEFTAISNARIDFTVAVTNHPSGKVPIEFLKHEFGQTNQNICPPTAGEMIAVSPDEDRNDLIERFTKVLQRNLRSLAREKLLAQKCALVNGALGKVEMMNMKSDSILGKMDITKEEKELAVKVIAAFGLMEQQILDHFSQKDKKTLKRVKDRQLEISFDGAIMYALSKCENDNERCSVVKTVVDFYKMFFENKETWKQEQKEVTKSIEKEPARYFTTTRFERAWNKMECKMNPSKQSEKVEVVCLPTATVHRH